MSFIKLFRVSVRYLDPPTYKGPFEYKKKHAFMKRYPFGVTKKSVNDEFNEVRRLRLMDIKEPSPFHMVWRHVEFKKTVWYEKVVLQRLGLHQYQCKIRTVIPNTPHFNNMLWQVKHLIRLRPVSFPDGIPTEKDIGATRMNWDTGVLTINNSYRISDERLEAAKLPDIYYGKYLREYLKHVSGMFFRNIPSNDVITVDGNDIESYELKLLNANNHRSEFYEPKPKKYL